ncbi:hypothetical protein ABW20_dc0101858 [Dactylellina cionopaga]|nr:hypothetical protein ABW20_dc0101858 [Dactylellina cionopaga]
MDNAKPSVDVNAIAETRTLVTAVKLKELYVEKKEREDHLLPILQRVEKATTEKEKLEILIEGHGNRNTKFLADIFEHNSNALDILAMAKNDPSISDEVFKPQRVQAEEAIRKLLLKSQYTSLFGSIFNEWMNFEGKSDLPDDENDGVRTPKSDDDSTINLSSGVMGRPEKYTQKAELESIIFSPDPDAKPEEYVKYLEDLFKQAEEEAKKLSTKKPTLRLESDDESDEMSDEEGREESSSKNDTDEYDYFGGYGSEDISLKKLRNTVGRFSGSFRKHESLQAADVKQAIHGLVSGELLTEPKKAACKEILLSDVIIDEIAMVLTLRLREIENWKYSESSIQLNFRRHLNGKYRCYADEPLLDAIFLQWIGVKWGMEQEVRSTMLPKETQKKSTKSIDIHRKIFMKEFFLTLLPESLYDFRTYNEDGDDQEKKDNEKIRRARNEELKQMLLQRLLIDRQYAEAVNPGKPFTVVQADAFRFAQSQSHEIILALMKFIGVTSHWLKFFETFLKLPARFEAGGEVRESKRGVPISHPLGLVFGEVQLFLMEFAINRATRGTLQVFRTMQMHDDFWWWGEDEKQCELGWKTIKEYSALAGTNWNLDKSGCVRISSQAVESDTSASSLPTGEISWGFIKLGTDGIWKIKQDEVEKHIEEMRRQMDSQKSILGIVSAYNRYMKFFVRNFAKPTRAFGKQHVEQIVAAVNKIHSALFPSHNGDVLSYIASLISSRFGEELPGKVLPSWLLMPVANGGLGVRNALFDIHPVLQAYIIEEEDYERQKRYGGNYYNPQNFKQCLKKDKVEYELVRDLWLKNPKIVKIEWEHDIPDKWFSGIEEWLASRDAARGSRRRRKQHPFMTFEEYVLGRRSKFDYWGDVWSGLSEAPDGINRYSFPERINKALLNNAYSPVEWLKADYKKTTPYWRSWLLSFGEQSLDAFGDFRITNEGRLPVAMIDIYMNLKTKWDQ